MKKLTLTILIAASLSAKAQQCPVASCTDSLPYTATRDTLVVNPGFTNPVWKIVAGPGIISGSNIIGLKPGATTVMWLEAGYGSSTVISFKVITVAAPPPRKSKMITYDDGSTQLTP